ncbi:MAG: Crp/Fnr family transcriptional regulator [Acidobacteriia bacterium]|nr:Crp/Fnr family transcriptional regulator [Terriglobia bacterium]
MLLSASPENLLLRAASRARRPSGQLKHVVFEAGQQLWAADVPIPYALFPLRGVVSLQVAVDRGRQADIGLVGREGYAEVPFLQGADRTRMIAVALTAGEALVIQPDLFRAYLSDAGFREAMERYMRMFMMMLSQMSVCNRVHTIEKSFIGRLLLMQDRTQADSFQLTQDFFSRVLGVRKATISRAAARLQEQGAIRYDRRGRLTILDRRKLDGQSCSCYQAIKAESDHLIAALGGF